MADISHVVGSDLAIGAAGDLAVVDRDDWTKQRILRRLLTNPGAYIWQLDYGGGLSALVGDTGSAQRVTALIRSQLRLEAAVATQPESTITFQSDETGNISASVSYTSAQNGTSQTLTVTGNG